jgi:hypothetical protein
MDRDGAHGPDTGHDCEGGQEQPLEEERVIDIGRRGEAGDRHAVPVGRDVVLGAPFAAVARVGAGAIATALGPHRAGIEDQVGMAAPHTDQQGMYFCQQAPFGPAPSSGATK